MKNKLVITLVSLAFLQVAVGGDAVVDALALQEKTLSELGVKGFYEKVCAEKWSAPLVRSNWATARTTDPTERARQVASYEFGRKILLALPDFLSATPESNPDKLLRVKKIVEFSEWITNSKGYGNALIARRAIDLATPILGNIIVDASASNEVMSDINKMLNPKWGTADFVSEVLNQEVGEVIFNSSSSQDEIQQFWKEGVRRYLLSKNPELKKTLPPEILVNPKLSSIVIKPEILPFFFDEPLPVPPTSAALMSGKHHEQIVLVILPGNLKKLKDLLMFRVGLRGSPDGSVKSDFYPGLKGSFDEAWRRFHDSGNAPQGSSLKLGLAAWATYDDILQKKLVPDDEALLINK